MAEFEVDCARAGVAPTAVLKGAGIHPTLWRRWQIGAVSPTLRNFEAARHHLDQLLAAQGLGPQLPPTVPSIAGDNLADTEPNSTIEKRGEIQ
ncbi:hypothetical protein [Caulobacter zeae]|uniref:hypothetical protein n=1 Tax=Caulobacter zeae TaxID=2055137 RepID=UPI0013FE4DBB|nr:hypothetical protein [Caulobacter zeae]